jgi:hypothetical protein
VRFLFGEDSGARVILATDVCFPSISPRQTFAICENQPKQLQQTSATSVSQPKQLRPTFETFSGLPKQSRPTFGTSASLPKRYLERRATKPPFRMIDTRNETDDVYSKITLVINVLIVMEGETAYAPFVAEQNELIKHHSDLIAQHQKTAETE